jgi:ABC-type amino acid transport substrate-binding protein
LIFRRLTAALATTLLMVVWLGTASAESIAVAIEDKDWKPYYSWVDGKPMGACVEIAAGAIRHMGAGVEWVRMPWARALQAVERKTVDAGLCGTLTEERSAYSIYPDEPLLSFDATLFVRPDSRFQTSDAARVTGQSFGMIKGYNFGDVDKALESRGMIRIEALNRSRLLKMLSIGRVDMILDSILPTFAESRELGYGGQIRALLPSLSETPGYLFFSRKPDHAGLAKRFSSALVRFKSTPAYDAIREKYGF